MGIHRLEQANNTHSYQNTHEIVERILLSVHTVNHLLIMKGTLFLTTTIQASISHINNPVDAESEERKPTSGVLNVCKKKVRRPITSDKL